MASYEYDISKHGAEEFSHVRYFCTEKGECALEDVPGDQTEAMRQMLDQRGADGWELVQLFFGADGVVAFWKRGR